MTRVAKMYRVAACAIAIGFVQVAPAVASTDNAISVPEPTDLLLFAMGAAGVAIGRRMHAKASRRDKDDGDEGGGTAD